MKEAYFVTGTDTDAGKTFVACGLIKNAVQHGRHAIGLKPVASGANIMGGELRNADALLLQQASNVVLPYARINPFCFTDPIAPHLAAEKSGVRLRADTIAHAVDAVLRTENIDYAIVEGAGGWRTPINATETLADVARALRLPVILVVGMKLGCINHALLTMEAIRADGLQLYGWVANDLGCPMENLQENIATLEAMLPAPRLFL